MPVTVPRMRQSWSMTTVLYEVYKNSPPTKVNEVAEEHFILVRDLSVLQGYENSCHLRSAKTSKRDITLQ